MTKDEIIRMAKEAGFAIQHFAVLPEPYNHISGYGEELERFAALVAEEATEQANARQNASWALMCEKMVAAEREACAKQLNALGNDHCAAAIRARGNK